MRDLASLFRLDLDDMELARAQFRSFSRQVPLLYVMLVGNSIAIMVEFFDPAQPLPTLMVPALVCAIVLVRARWWWAARDRFAALTDAEVVEGLKRIAMFAVVIPLTFNTWCLWLYAHGDAISRSHLVFFLALTLVSTVFCAMAIRPAAMRVGALGSLCFVVVFGVVNHDMWLEATVLGFVCFGMMVVADRYTRDFAKMIASQRDLRNRQAEAERLSDENRRIALTDSLSNLPNRRALLDRLDKLEAGGGHSADSLAVLFIDLDGFKEVNDAHGHQAGDVLIRSLSARLRGLCPAGATLARVGGDEFVVLIEKPGASACALTLAKMMSEEISLAALVDRHVLQVGASIGIATNADELVSAPELLRRADTAMYNVKIGGKGRIASYTTAFDVGRLRRLSIESEIARGLDQGEFDVVYQPVVQASDGTVIGAEALVRWPRRPGGELPPEDFIGIAEATGQILPLGLFVLERAATDFRALGDLKLSVNVSPAQFRDPGFEREVAKILRRTRFQPHRLQFEITENYLLSNPDRATRAIDGFKALGMSIALDDFGTGFTSIHYLRAYGFSHIKIDKSLLRGLQPGTKPAMVLGGVIAMAIGLDMTVIAEGVETEDEAAILRAAGCHKFQGYLFGRPMQLGDFIAQSGMAAMPRARTERLRKAG